MIGVSVQVEPSGMIEQPLLDVLVPDSARSFASREARPARRVFHPPARLCVGSADIKGGACGRHRT